MKRRLMALAAALLALLVLLSCRQKAAAAPSPGPLEADKVNLVFLDVGQGDSTLITFPNGERLIIDTGPESSRRQLVQQLKALGIDRVDYLFLTHPHEDHCGNLGTLVRKFHIKGVYFEGLPADYGSGMVIARRRGVYCRQVWGGEAFSFGEATLRVLSPLPDVYYPEVNDGSMVLSLSYGENQALFMADGTFETEESLLFCYPRELLQAQVLKVGHHGSASSTSDVFLKVVEPEVAVISVGRDNEYKHPTQEALDRLEAAGCRILRTDLLSRVQIVLDGKQARVVE